MAFFCFYWSPWPSRTPFALGIFQFKSDPWSSFCAIENVSGFVSTFRCGQNQLQKSRISILSPSWKSLYFQRGCTKFDYMEHSFLFSINKGPQSSELLFCSKFLSQIEIKKDRIFQKCQKIQFSGHKMSIIKFSLNFS